MNKKWHVLFCDPGRRPCPVSEFLDSLRQEHRVKVLHFIELLEEMGPTLHRPYADLLEDGIHELRIKLSGEQIRLLYFFCYEKFIVVYRALKKSGDQVPTEYIRETKKYREEFLSRMDQDTLRRISDGEF